MTLTPSDILTEDYRIRQNIEGRKNNLDQLLGIKLHWHALLKFKSSPTSSAEAKERNACCFDPETHVMYSHLTSTLRTEVIRTMDRGSEIEACREHWKWSGTFTALMRGVSCWNRSVKSRANVWTNEQLTWREREKRIWYLSHWCRMTSPLKMTGRLSTYFLLSFHTKPQYILTGSLLKISFYSWCYRC